MIGGAISCVDPGCPPKDTHVLLSSLVWRCCPLPHVAHEVIEPCSIAGGSVPGWAAPPPHSPAPRYQRLPWWCFSPPHPSGRMIPPTHLRVWSNVIKSYHSYSVGGKRSLGRRHGSHPQPCHPWGTFPEGEKFTLKNVPSCSKVVCSCLPKGKPRSYCCVIWGRMKGMRQCAEVPNLSSQTSQLMASAMTSWLDWEMCGLPCAHSGLCQAHPTPTFSTLSSFPRSALNPMCSGAVGRLPLPSFVLSTPSLSSQGWLMPALCSAVPSLSLLPPTGLTLPPLP